MPDTEGRLSPAETNHIILWIQQQAGGEMPLCPISGHQSWIVAPNVSQAIVFPAGTQVYADAPYPYVTVLCTACGYYMHFNAALMGLYPAPPPMPPRPLGGSDAPR